MSAAGIAAGPCFRDDEVVADAHVAARNMLVEMPRTDGVDEPVLVPGNPVKLTNVAEGPETRMPWLGEHTDAVLRRGARARRRRRWRRCGPTASSPEAPESQRRSGGSVRSRDGAGAVLELRRARRRRLAARRAVGRRRPGRRRRPRDHRQPPLVAGRGPGPRPGRLARGTRPPRPRPLHQAARAVRHARPRRRPRRRARPPRARAGRAGRPLDGRLRRHHRGHRAPRPAGRPSCSSTAASRSRCPAASTPTTCSPASSARRSPASR